MDWRSLFDIHKAPFKAAVIVALATGGLFLSVPWIAMRISLEPGVLTNWTMGLAVGFSLASALIVVDVLWAIGRGARGIFRFFRAGGAIGHLDHKERSVLREFWMQGGRVISLPVADATVVGLVDKGILERVGDRVDGRSRAPYRFTAAARVYFEPAMIDLPEGRDPTRKELERFEAVRPDFNRLPY